MKTILSIEKSEHLIRLGIDEKKAHEFVWNEPCDKLSKCFRLQDILSILPKEIELEGVRASLQMYQHLAGYWTASYVIYDSNKIIRQRPLSADKELIIALYQLLIWAITNGHVKTEKQ